MHPHAQPDIAPSEVLASDKSIAQSKHPLHEGEILGVMQPALGGGTIIGLTIVTQLHPLVRSTDRSLIPLVVTTLQEALFELLLQGFKTVVSSGQDQQVDLETVALVTSWAIFGTGFQCFRQWDEQMMDLPWENVLEETSSITQFPRSALRTGLSSGHHLDGIREASWLLLCYLFLLPPSKIGSGPYRTVAIGSFSSVTGIRGGRRGRVRAGHGSAALVQTGLPGEP